MELSIFTAYPTLFFEKGIYNSMDEALSATKKMGVDSAEIFTFEFDAFPFKTYVECLNRNDIRLNTIIVTSSFTNDDKNNYDAEISKIKRTIDDAANAGAKFVMVVPDANNVTSHSEKDRVLSSIITGMTEVTDYAKNTPVTVTMENFSLHTHPYSTIDEMLYIMQNVPNLKYTLDSGNFACVQNDVLKAYDVLKDYIVNVHMKDFKEYEFGCIVRPNIPVLDGCALGEGFVPLDALMNKLKADKYNGSLVMEINSDRNVPDDFVHSAEYLRRIINA